MKRCRFRCGGERGDGLIAKARLGNNKLGKMDTVLTSRTGVPSEAPSIPNTVPVVEQSSNADRLSTMPTAADSHHTDINICSEPTSTDSASNLATHAIVPSPNALGTRHTDQLYKLDPTGTGLDIEFDSSEDGKAMAMAPQVLRPGRKHGRTSLRPAARAKRRRSLVVPEIRVWPPDSEIHGGDALIQPMRVGKPGEMVRGRTRVEMRECYAFQSATNALGPTFAPEIRIERRARSVPRDILTQELYEAPTTGPGEWIDWERKRAVMRGNRVTA